MGRYGWHGSILAQSRISESNFGEPVPLKPLPLVQYQGNTGEAIALRLTLKPLEGKEGRPLFPYGTTGIPDVVDNPAVPGARAGFTRTIVGAPPPNPVSGTPIYALIKWGVGESRRNQLVCDWPMNGASVELVASYVEAFGQISPVTLFLPGSPQLPDIAAEIGPSQGMGYNDEPLTFCQTLDMSGGPLQVAVPEFARSVEVAAPETFGVGDFLELSFAGMDPALSINFATRLNFESGNRAPVELPVPGKAVVLIITTTGAVTPVVFLQWRIAP